MNCLVSLLYASTVTTELSGLQTVSSFVVQVCQSSDNARKRSQDTSKEASVTETPATCSLRHSETTSQITNLPLQSSYIKSSSLVVQSLHGAMLSTCVKAPAVICHPSVLQSHKVKRRLLMS